MVQLTTIMPDHAQWCLYKLGWAKSSIGHFIWLHLDENGPLVQALS